jgi:hypothetical protein
MSFIRIMYIMEPTDIPNPPRTLLGLAERLAQRDAPDLQKPSMRMPS